MMFVGQVAKLPDIVTPTCQVACGNLTCKYPPVARQALDRDDISKIDKIRFTAMLRL
jgi:hypothetical protein